MLPVIEFFDLTAGDSDEDNSTNTADAVADVADNHNLPVSSIAVMSGVKARIVEIESTIFTRHRQPNIPTVPHAAPTNAEQPTVPHAAPTNADIDFWGGGHFADAKPEVSCGGGHSGDATASEHDADDLATLRKLITLDLADPPSRLSEAEADPCFFPGTPKHSPEYSEQRNALSRNDPS